MAKKPTRRKRRTRRKYSDEMKAEAVQMLLDGHSAVSVAKNLGLSGTSILYRWKAVQLQESGPAADGSRFPSSSAGGRTASRRAGA